MTRRPVRKSSGKLFFFLLLFGVPFLFVLTCYYVIGARFLPQERTTILFLSDPVTVMSFEPTKKQWSTVQFSAQTHVGGIQGLGDYAVDALWNLAATQGSPSAIVLGSVSDELGVSIEYFIGKKGNIWEKDIQNYFSFFGLVQRLSKQLDTNIPILLHVALTRSFRSTENHKIQTLLLDVGNGLIEKKLPDNSRVVEFNRDQFDSLTTDIFEDSQIREEGLRIAVFNTTGRPFLGSRVARILDRLGTMVVQVGNEETAVEDCELTGSSELLATKTSKSIQELFQCIPVVQEEQKRADLEMRIGKVYERRFIPPLLLPQD